MIQIGDKYFCIKTVIMEKEYDDDDDDIAYIQGKVYTSEINGCLTNQHGESDHLWSRTDELNEHFKKIDGKMRVYCNKRNSGCNGGMIIVAANCVEEANDILQNTKKDYLIDNYNPNGWFLIPNLYCDCDIPQFIEEAGYNN